MHFLKTILMKTVVGWNVDSTSRCGYETNVGNNGIWTAFEYRLFRLLNKCSSFCDTAFVLQQYIYIYIRVQN